ncbi:hypothetical protein BJV82DRAFT_206308 [Fennellomyces sp. T-0311]|nr:hypothetical protein BJV82DRAFT_206308 [Fennellomyces sp. T-0311]
MIIAGHRRTHDTQSTTPLIFSHEESIMNFKSNGNTVTSYDAFTGGMISSSNVPTIPASSNPSFDYVSSFHNFVPQPPGPLALTSHHQQQQRQPQHHQQQQQDASTLARTYVAPMTSGSTIATTSSTDYFKPPADINNQVDKDEVIVDEHHQCPRGWNEGRPGQDPIINMVMMGGGGSRSNSSGSGGYPDDSLVTPCTYYSPSSAIQSSPSSDFSPPPNLFMGSNSTVAPFGRPQYIKRRRSSALAITPVHDAIVDTPRHQLQHEPVAATAAYQPSAVMPGNYYSPIPSQPSLGIQPQHQQQHYVATSGSTSTMVTPTSSATGTPSPCSFPGSASSSSSAGQPMIDQRNASMYVFCFFFSNSFRKGALMRRTMGSQG